MLDIITASDTEPHRHYTEPQQWFRAVCRHVLAVSHSNGYIERERLHVQGAGCS